MFNEVISSTPFYGGIADDMFKNITSFLTNGYYGDATFISTMRAILDTRMKPEDTIGLCVDMRRPPSDVIDMEPKEMLERILPEFMYTEELKDKFIVIDTYTDDADKTKAVMEKIESVFMSEFEGFKVHEKIKLFYNSFPTLGYINEELKTSVIFVGGIDYRRYHYLQCSVIAAIPWYVDPKTLTPDEISIVKAMTLKDGQTQYREAINNIAKRYDFKSAKIKKELDGFEVLCERVAKENASRQLDDFNRRIEEMMSRMNSLIKDRRDCLIRISGLDAYIDANGSNNVMDYFLSTNNAVYENIDGTRITYGLKGYLAMFDRSYAESLVSNTSSLLYEGIKNKKEFKKLYNAIFVDETIRVKFCAKFRLDLTGRVEALSGVGYDSFEYAGYLPNPHIQHHSCISENASIIESRLLSGDYIAAIQQTFASAQNLNLTDYTVVSEFVRGLKENYTTRGAGYIELPDGSVVNVEQAIEWINKQEG